MVLKEFKKHDAITAETEERKTRVMNNVVTLYNNYFNFYTKTYNESALNEKEGRDPNKFKIADNELPEWLESNNDFNETKILIDGIRTGTYKAQVSKEDKVFNDSNRLIIHINNNKVKKKDAVERLKKSISDLDQLKQKQSTAFENKMIQVVYQLFN